jgi:hypothetical protein
VIISLAYYLFSLCILQLLEHTAPVYIGSLIAYLRREAFAFAVHDLCMKRHRRQPFLCAPWDLSREGYWTRVRCARIQSKISVATTNFVLATFCACTTFN